MRFPKLDEAARQKELRKLQDNIVLAQERGAAKPALSPEALRQNAIRYLATGQMPAMGMGGAESRIAVLNEAAEIGPAVNIAMQSAGYRVDQNSLNNLTRIEGQINSFKRTVQMNLDLMQAALAKLPDAGIQWLNKPYRTFLERMGDVDMVEFNAIRTIDLTEVARTIMTSAGTGVLAQHDREEIDNLLKGNFTVKQAERVITLLREALDNRTKAHAAEIKAIEKRMTDRIESELTGSGGNMDDIEVWDFDASGNLVPISRNGVPVSALGIGTERQSATTNPKAVAPSPQPTTTAADILRRGLDYVWSDKRNPRQGDANGKTSNNDPLEIF
jgi:hypothetical protein